MNEKELRVLIVEDNPADAELMELELMNGGYAPRVLRVETAPAMQAALEAEGWDLVLSDYLLPHFSGLAALDLLQASKKDIPFILISGTAGEDIAVRSMKAGAQDFFVKGKLALLASAIERELRERELRSAVMGRHEETLDALWQSEERFRLLVDAVKDFAIFMIDTNGRIASWNEGAERMTGFTAEDVLGKSVSTLRPPDRADPDRLRRELDAIRQQGPAEWDDLGIKKDGSRYLPHIYCSPIFERSGKFLGFVSITRDVTEQRNLEAQLAQSQRLESLGQLAGGIAHDFNNMLMVIMTRCDILLRSLEPEKQRQFVSDIRTAALKNRDLTQHLLAAARRQVLEPQVVDLNTVINSAVQLLAPTLGENIEIRRELQEPLWSVHADPSKLDQVLLNLAINARDAMPSGGSLTIESRNVKADSSYARQHLGLREGEYVSLVVSDTGSGIPPEIRDRIYDPFFTTKEPGRGTGLGLSVVRGIVEQTGGRVWMYSEEGRGTTFKILLPRYFGERQTVGIDESSPQRGTETILLVEDEELLRAVVRESLEEHGYRVLEARNSAEALSISNSFSDAIHLLLTDVIMPGMTGLALAARLSSERPQIRVIYMSGYTSQAVINHAALPVEVRYLEKPIPTNVLLRTIRAALQA
jgi:PAS domain S-box-containing protein